MSDKLNKVICNDDQANTGHGDCPIHYKFEGLIQVPKSKRFTVAELNDLGTTLNTLIRSNSKINRAFPFPKVEKNDPKGGDAVVITFDSGTEVTTFENPYIIGFEFYEGGLAVSNSLRTRNGSDLAFLLFDKQRVYGTVINGQFAGVPALNFWCSPQKLGSFKIANIYMAKFNVNTKDLNDNVWHVPNDFGIENLKGLKNVDLKPTATPDAITAAGVLDLSALVRLDGEDYATNYATQLATAGLFTAKNASTGLAIPVTTTTVANGKITLTLPTSNANYPAIGGAVTIVPPTLTQLSTAGILDAEIQSVTVERTV